MKEIWEGLQWIWKWYPAIWKLLIPDDPFRSRSVKYWRNTWRVVTIGAAIFGWSAGPLLLDGPVSQRELAAYGFCALAVLGLLTRFRPLDRETPLWRPFGCVCIFLLLPYLVPWVAYRLNAFINDHWNGSIDKWMPDAPDPAINGHDALINVAPYLTFAVLAGLLLVVERRYAPSPSDRLGLS